METDLDKIKSALSNIKSTDIFSDASVPLEEDTYGNDTLILNSTMNSTFGAVGSTYSIGSSSTLPGYGNITIGHATGAHGMGTYYTNNASTPSSLQVSGDAEFEGNVKIKGRDITKLFEKIEDRLAILADPDPKKLEKFAALKKAYDHYKLMEKLIAED
jgi:hypothetical protein